MKRNISILAIILSMIALAYGQQSVKEFRVMDPMGRNVVQFRTSAPLEDIVGTTSQIIGMVNVNPADLKATGPLAQFEVDLNSLKTGIDLRDRHMREQYLHTDRYPKAIFTLKNVKKASSDKLQPGKPVKLTAEGTFELHGVKKEIPVDVLVTYVPESKETMGKLPGNLIRITSNFDVRLADYGIERPQMVLLKVGEVAHVTVDTFASDADGQKTAMWMDQMKKMMSSQ
jgi:polyisoprenoid-binding protein YceI